ncbi:MAG: hypothetical protein ABI354_00380 [Candidatus Saccharimonadales bacterium]
MGQKSKPRTIRMPFATDLGPRMGSGQDNAVFQMLHKNPSPGMKPHERQPSGTVLKVNHKTASTHRVRHHDDREAAMRGVLYKKHKYDILKRFLGDFIPESSFVLGNVTENTTERYAEYTVQQEVPKVSLNDLSDEQKKDPRIKAQVVSLMNRLKFMYSVLGEVNARTADGVSLDGKLDLGGVSDYVLAESLDRGFTGADADAIINSNSSSNLLVDSGSMRLYCIDFDQGQWRPGMDEAKAMAMEIADQRDAVVGNLGTVASNGAFSQPEFEFHPVE